MPFFYQTFRSACLQFLGLIPCLEFKLHFFPFKKKNGFWGIPGPPYCGIGATIRIGREMLCLPYAGFSSLSLHIKKSKISQIIKKNRKKSLKDYPPLPTPPLSSLLLIFSVDKNQNQLSLKCFKTK